MIFNCILIKLPHTKFNVGNNNSPRISTEQNIIKKQATVMKMDMMDSVTFSKHFLLTFSL